MVKIRLAKIEDCEECYKLSRIEELRPAGSDFISKGYFELFVDENKMFFVAEESGKIVGYILGEPMKGNLAHLGLLTVDQTLRGKGIGKNLFEAFKNRCDKAGLKEILLYAPKFNENTLNFYRKLGFKEGKEHIQFLL
jgi:ribosomal protein S18 acetylase RimI-like enzyme